MYTFWDSLFIVLKSLRLYRLNIEQEDSQLVIYY